MTTANDPEAMMQANQTETDAMLQAVGQSISDWSFVEEGLFEIFFRLMGCPALGPPSCAFIKAGNMRAKIEMVDSTVRHSPAGRKVLTKWNELKERLKSPQAGRNALAHRRVITLKIGNAKSQVALVEYKHDIRHFLEEESSVPSHMKIDRVKALSKEFRGLGQRFLDLTHIRRPF